MTEKANANLILEFRKVNKMSVKEFCEQSNIGTTTYYKIINGEGVKIQTLSGIIKTMNVPLNELLNK